MIKNYLDGRNYKILQTCILDANIVLMSYFEFYVIIIIFLLIDTIRSDAMLYDDICLLPENIDRQG